MMAIDNSEFHRRTSTLEMLTELSRIRPLTALEERRLQRAIRTVYGDKGTQKPWRHGDEMRLATYLIRGKRPPAIAILMGRTERAIWRKMYKLGWGVKLIRCEGQSSMAADSENGEG